MPIYEYKCSQCDKVFEEWLKVSEACETAPCPTCRAEAKHIISNTSFVLKGGGWYVTDYGYRKGAQENSPNGGTQAESTPPSENAASVENAASSADTAAPAPPPAPSAPAVSSGAGTTA